MLTFILNFCRFAKRGKFNCPDIFISNKVTGLKILRNFGHLIVNAHFDLSSPRRYSEMLSRYIVEYSSQSLVEMILQCANDYILQNTQKPFTNVKSLHLDCCNFQYEYTFPNEQFPNLKSLKLADNYYGNVPYPKPIRMHIGSALTDFAFHDSDLFDMNGIVRLLQLNPQLKKLELCLDFYSTDCEYFFKILKEYCPNLKHFGYCTNNEHTYFYFDDFEPIHFDKLETLILCDIENMNIPYISTNLQSLTIRTSAKNISSTAISIFLGTISHLKSLKFELSNIIDLSNFFRIESLLLNIEELNIGILNVDIPSDSLIYFLTQNHSLKRFWLTTRLKYIRQFYDTIRSSDTQFKIRNNAMEFIITRATDHSSMKYVLRFITIGFEGSDKAPEETNFVDEYGLNNRLMECCTYNESSHLTSKKYDQYKNALVKSLIDVPGNERYLLEHFYY